MPGREFYLWQVHSITARVALDLVDGLSRALADPRHKQGEELGGVLFGSIQQPGIIEITRFEFIHSEHRRGTVFALGMRERQRIARQLASLQGRSEAHPVGFFRTHLRPGLFLDQDDFAFMTDAFADPSQVALLIRPDASGPPAAGFFIWEDGDLDRRQTLLSFPFDSQSLRAQGPVESQPVQPPKALLPSVHIPLPQVRKPLLGWSVAALAVITLVALGMQYRPAPAAPRKEVERPLNIALQQKGDAVIVDWDKRATALKQASSGILTINDGGSTQTLNLSRTELDHGKVQFWPRSNEVTVHMDLTHQDEAGSTANIAIPRTPLQTALAKPSPVPTAPVPAAPMSPRQTTAKRRQRPAPKSESNLVAVAVPPMTWPAAPAPEAKPAVEPPPEPPAMPPPSLPVRTRTVAVSISVEPKQSSELKRVVSHVPLLGRSFHAEGGTDYSPAHPVHTLEPHVPQMLAEDLSHEVSIDVKVSIDKHGSVKNAQVLNGGKSEFANLAANTAETTSWEPAKQGDRTVSSDVIVHYRFSPASQAQ